MGNTIKKSTVEGENKGLGSMLSEDRISEIAKRETSKERFAGPKTEEGKKKSLRNLRPKQAAIDLDNVSEDELPNIDIDSLPDKENIPLFYLNAHKILNREEQLLYIRKWAEYTSDFEFNDSADEALLNVVIMEEIIYNRLLRSQLTNPHEDLSKQMTESVKRQEQSLQSLGISRKQRLGTKAGKEENIATLIQDFDKQKLIDLENKNATALEEENVLAGKKMEQYSKELSEVSLLESEAPEHKTEEVVHAIVESDDLKVREGLSKDPREQGISNTLRNILKEAALGG